MNMGCTSLGDKVVELLLLSGQEKAFSDLKTVSEEVYLGISGRPDLNQSYQAASTPLVRNSFFRWP